MQINPQAGITKLRSNGKTRRRRGRVGQEAVVCDIGFVVDLSGNGMKVRARRVPEGDFMTTLRGLGHSELQLKARVVWTKRAGIFQKLLGVEFVDVTPEQAKKIAELGMLNRQRRVI